MSGLAVGTRLSVVVPIQVSEDEEWPAGTLAEIVATCPLDQPSDFGAYSYEVQADGLSVGSFAEIDLVGEHAWFRVL